MDWWIDTKWACGLVVTDDKGWITNSAPIFRRLRGQNLFTLPYKRIQLNEAR